MKCYLSFKPVKNRTGKAGLALSFSAIYLGTQITFICSKHVLHCGKAHNYAGWKFMRLFRPFTLSRRCAFPA